MVPQDLRPLFWDTNLENFNPVAYPAYTIARVLEFGDDKAVAWLWDTFSEAQIVEVLRAERGSPEGPRISGRSSTTYPRKRSQRSGWPSEFPILPKPGADQYGKE
jgi:hypothetical protein